MVKEHKLLDSMVSNLVICPAQGLECMGSLQDQEKMGFLVVESKVNMPGISHLHHLLLTVRSLAHLELLHFPTL